MRYVALLLCLCTAGCGESAPQKPPEWTVSAPAAPAGKAGSDWPGFLGPLGTSMSTEKGILSPWPEKGLRVVWHRKTGTGYGVPSISRGRLYLFDRHGDQARLTCMDRKTGEEIWRFEYPTNYRDHYGYNNGP